MTAGTVLREMIAAEGVEIIDRGHGVARGNFNIKCPFCGAADQGHHMGINLDTGYWGCWRSQDHRGRSPIRLMVQILGLPVWRVRELLGIRSTPEINTFGAIKERWEATPAKLAAEEPDRPGLAWPKEFRDLDDIRPSAQRFWDYVESRGFTALSVLHVAQVFSIKYAVTGPFKDRVILPYFLKDQLVTWTARSVYPDVRLRYRDLDQESSAVHKDQLLYNYDAAAMGGRILIVLEGQFDVVKGEWAGRSRGIHCVGLGTNNMSDAQMLQLAELASAYDHVFIAMDAPSEFSALHSYRMAKKLTGVVDARVLDAHELGKDFGGATLRDISALYTRLLDESV